MSQFPVCTHGILKHDCQHCNKPVQQAEVVCGDVDANKELERCHCGKLRQAGRPHYYERSDAHMYGGI